MNTENDPEEESSSVSLEVLILSVIMAISIVLAVEHIIDNATSIIISSLIIVYGLFGMYRTIG